MQKKKSQLLLQIAELTNKIAIIDTYLCAEENVLSAPILVKTVPQVIIAYVQKRIDSYDELFHLMPLMGSEMEKVGCQCAKLEYCFTNYLEPMYKEKQILIETCEAVTEQRAETEWLKFKTMPEITAACIYHKGSYDSLPMSYAAVIRYIEENGYHICGNIRESYIDGVWNKDTPAEWLTEIQVPVEKELE